MKGIKIVLLFLLGICLASAAVCAGFTEAAAAGELIPSNVDFSDDFESYELGTQMSSLTEDYALFNSSDETVAADPADPSNRAMHIRVATRMQFEFNSVLTRNFSVSYRFYATRRTEWIGLNVRRQTRGPGAFYDTMQSYFNLIRIGYTERATDNQTIRFSPQYYNRSALTYIDSYHPTTEYTFDSAYNSWHSVFIQYTDDRIYAALDGDVLFDYAYEGGINSPGYISMAIQDGDVYLDDIRIVSEDRYSVTVENNESAGRAYANRTTASENSEIVLTAEPNPGFEFAGWYEGEQLLSTEPVYTVAGQTTADRVFEAAWRTGSYKVSVGSADAGRGYQVITDLSGNAADEFEALTDLRATALAESGYEFAAWYEGDAVVSTENPYYFEMPVHDYALTAKYVPAGTPRHALTVRSETKGTGGTAGVSSVSEGGSAAGGGTYHEGITVQLRAEENDRYSFSGWYLGEELVSEEKEFIVEVSQPAEYTAKFADRLYSVTVVNGTGGTVSRYAFIYGTRFSVTPDIASEGFAFRDWSVENAEGNTEAGGRITVTVEQDGILLQANYTRNIHTVTVTTTQTGIGATGGGNREFGETVVIVPSQKEGYRLTGYEVTGAVGTISEDGSLSFVMPDNPVSVRLRYEVVRATPAAREIGGRAILSVVLLSVTAIIVFRIVRTKKNGK